MSKNKLFKDLEISNKPNRTGFDLSHNVKFTAKCGELLPVMHRTLMPGDNIKLNLSNFTRTSPVNTAAFTKVREYFDVFFVPYRIIGKHLPHVLAQDKDNPTTAQSSVSNRTLPTSVPYVQFEKFYRYTNEPILNEGGYVQTLMNFKNSFGFNRGVLATKLLNHLGYCNYSLHDTRSLWSHVSPDVDETEGVVNTNPFGAYPSVSILPLACYQKIYYDFFRNTQWENNQPYNYNFDYQNDGNSLFYVSTLNPLNSTYWQNPTIFDLRYSNYPRDLFFGLLPNSQYGDEAIVDIERSSTDDTTTFEPLIPEGNSSINVKVSETPTANEDHLITGSSNGEPTDLPYLSTLGINLDIDKIVDNLGQNFSILNFRKAQFLQKYKEIIGSGSKDYQSIVKKIFGVDVPDTLADHSIYLGGYTSDVKISEVENTNLVDGAEAIIKGKGIGQSNSDTIDFTANEFGHIMVIYHAQPVIDYSLNAFHFDVTKVNVDDYANPVFDKLGFQELPTWYLDNSVEANTQYNPFIGWTTRYFDYKTSVDVTLDDFRETLKSWVSPVNFDYLKEFIVNGVISINSEFFKVNPRILDTIFKRTADDFITSDQLQVSANISFHAVRNLDYIGLPY